MCFASFFNAISLTLFEFGIFPSQLKWLQCKTMNILIMIWHWTKLLCLNNKSVRLFCPFTDAWTLVLLVFMLDVFKLIFVFVFFINCCYCKRKFSWEKISQFYCCIYFKNINYEMNNILHCKIWLYDQNLYEFNLFTVKFFSFST